MRNILFSKTRAEGDGGGGGGGGGEDMLPGKIERVFYVNPYGNEVYLSANARVIHALRDADVLIYSIGSLFTRCNPSSLPLPFPFLLFADLSLPLSLTFGQC